MSTTTLTQTTSSKIAAALLGARHLAGSPAMGMVLTLIVVCSEDELPQSIDAALEAGHEHSSRVLVVVTGLRGRASNIDAEVRVGEGVPGEAVILRMHGPVAAHPASVLRPLLLPDSPVVVFWPGSSPTTPADDEIGKLGMRRITDAMGTKRPLPALTHHAENYIPGDTDLTWTRITPWRSLLAAALDQYPARVESGTVEAERNNASANLLAAWLQSRLSVPVVRKTSPGPGITAVRMTTAAGDIAITRPDGLIASYSVPGQPTRIVALKRRRVAELIAEELRRLDPDDVFALALQSLLVHDGNKSTGTAARPRRAKAPALRSPARQSDSTASAPTHEAASAAKKAVIDAARAKAPAKKTTAKKTATKKTTAKKTAAKKAPRKTADG